MPACNPFERHRTNPDGLEKKTPLFFNSVVMAPCHHIDGKASPMAVRDRTAATRTSNKEGRLRSTRKKKEEILES